MIKMNRTKSDERGIIALVTVVLIALLLTVITIGLTRSMITNQRQTIDEQSSNQAYYAAESGIQDAISKIKAAQKDGTPFPEINTCSSASNAVLGGDSSVINSCLLISSDVMDSEHTIVDQDTLQLDISPTNPFASLTIDWHRNGNGDGFDGPVGAITSQAGVNPTAASYGANPAVLRAMVSVVPKTGGITRNEYRDKTSNVFFTPEPSIRPLGVIAAGVTASGSCSTASDYVCSATFNFGSNISRVMLRLRPLYKQAHVRISLKNAGGVSVKPEIQAVIDSTGKVGEVVKRLQVRYPISERFTDGVPDYSIESSYGICKDIVFTTDTSPSDLSEAACPTLHP